jgi:hypothetical protein
VLLVTLAAASFAQDAPPVPAAPASPTADQRAAPSADVPATVAAPSTSPRGQIQGSASVRRNVPVVGAVVNLRRVDSTSELRLTTTDAKGAFRFDGLADGRYRCEVASDGFATVVKDNVDLRAPFRAVVEVTMARVTPGAALQPDAPGTAGVLDRAAPVALRGIVRDDRGRGTGEVRVRLVREDGSEDPREKVTTLGGEFSFDALKPGRWHVEILGAGLLPLRTTIALEEQTTLSASLVPQPADHVLAIEDLMPREEPVPPL